MSLIFKSYDPVRHQQRAKWRRQKRSAERSTLVPSSATCIGTPLPQSLVAGHNCSGVDDKFIPLTNPDGPEDPYSGFPSVEEILELYSSLDTNVLSIYTPTSANPLSYPDSAIDIQDVSSGSSCQDEAYKDDRLRRKLLTAIATVPSAPELNIRREAYNVNPSGTPASTTVSAEESDTGISPAEHVWKSDAETPSSIASSISTPATATSPIYQKRTSIWRNQDSFVDSEDGAQDSCTRMADLDVPDAISKDALSGVDRPVLEFQDNIAPEPLSSDSSNRLLNQDIQAVRVLASAASIMEESVAEPSVTELSVTEPSITEPSSAEKTPAQDVASSSTKRSFSESATTSDSQPFNSEVCQSSKRLRFTSLSSEEAVSTLLCIHNMISNVLAKLDQDQPHSLIPDVSVQSMSDTIQVAVDGVGDDSGDDTSSIGSSFDDSDSETELTTSQPQGSQQRSTQRRRWTEKEEKLLWALKGTQKRNGGKPSDYQIANRLDRTKSGVKQHWDIMLQKSGGKY